MEHIEAQIDSGKIKGGVKLYDKLDHIPVRDHLYMNYDKEFGR